MHLKRGVDLREKRGRDGMERVEYRRWRGIGGVK